MTREKMKVLFITNVVGSSLGNFSLSSIHAAKKIGYEFHMAADFSKYKDNSRELGVHVHHIDIKRNPFDLGNLKAYRQLMRLIEEYEIDFIHCNTPIGGVLGRLCGKNSPRIKRVLYTAHGFHFYDGAPKINNIFKKVESFLAKYTDNIITINTEDYEAAQNFNLKEGGKVYYLPGVGIDIESKSNITSERLELLNEFNLSEDAFLIISLGELNKNKNNTIILDALHQINNPKIHYILCGEGTYEIKLRKKAKRYSLNENIHFAGYRNDALNLLSSVDLFVLPSYREGLSRSLMEAMSAGLPVVASKIRGNVDLIKDGKGGYLNKPNDTEGWSDAIRILKENEDIRKRMGNHNMQSIKEYDAENIKEKMVDIYSAL